MNDLAMIFFEYIVFAFKIFTILLAAIVVTFIDFRRFKARYGKRTFFQFYFRYARVEMETEDPTPLFMLKTAGMLVWMGYFTLLFFA